MKKTVSLLLASILSSTALAEVPGLEIANKIGYAYYGTATIDGVISEGEWTAAQKHGSNVIATFINNEAGQFVPPSGDEDLSGEFWAMWDEEALYLLVVAKDESFPSIPENAGRGDAITVYTSAAYTRQFGMYQSHGYDSLSDIQALFNLRQNGLIEVNHGLYSYESNAPFPDTVVATYTRTDDGYIAELKIPIEVLLGSNGETGVSFEGGIFFDGPDIAGVGAEREFIGFEINLQDSDNNLDRETKIAWYGGREGRVLDLQWADTEMWGTLVFVQPEIEGGCTVNATVFTAPYFPAQGEGFVFNMSMESFLYVGFCPFAYDYNTQDWWYVFEDSTDPEGFFVYSFNDSVWYFVYAGFVLPL